VGEINRYVTDTGNKDIRVAFIVASRRDDEWKGVTPTPRLTSVPLTEFNNDIAQQALHDLATEMQRPFSSAEFRRNADRVHGLTEGLPALLVRCLQWVRAEEWLGMDRLETQELFEEIANPYVRQELLAPASLVPVERVGNERRLRVLVHAYRILAPYRLFTRSHLRHHLDIDRDFRYELDSADLNMQDLWEDINGTALLKRPLNEPWQEIHSAIRRLLYRYFYRTDNQRANAQNEAREFVEVWAERQAGTDQVVAMVECLWHEAAALALSNPADMEQRLTASARTLSRALQQSPAFALSDLRAFAVQRMRNDEELQEAVGKIDGLFGRLAEIVARPEG
jgi:hypothetical protein